MGSQIRRGSSSDPSGTNWTPAMETYFIDLLLDQVHRGNRMGYTFNIQAWNEMLSLFNANFGYLYDIHFLKCRYTALWMQFNNIKNLLDQDGFSWDETRQMVVANNHVWDAYIKAHPDAQAYRSKPLANIKDWCLIHAHKGVDGRYSLASHDLDFDDDVQVVNTGNARENEYHSSDGDVYVGQSWTSHMNCYLADLLLNQALKGNKINHDFTYEAWCEIFTLFCAKFGSHYTKDALKDRYKYLKSQYNDLKVHIKQPGFAWDGKQEVVTVKDELWNSYIKVHPDALSYRNKFVPIYYKLCLIYGQEISDGSVYHINNGPISTVGGDEDIQDCSIGDCSRTDWTPSMDRCLIDIMLEEVRRGNNINHVLNSPAWIDILILFKERFGIQFDKDYLKSCCKGLEKLYHDLRYILEQRGFSWDETKQMITAYDGDWDAYIKEHPDGKSYRNHRQPNYNDLCLIYGNSDAELACNLATQNAGYDCIKFQNSHSRSDWTPPMDRYFMDLMLDEVRNGSMVSHKFDELTWRDMVAKFSAEFGSQYNIDVLKNRFMILRKIFNDMKILLNKSGFAWDEMQQMITADERLWHAYVKEYPDVKAYRYRALPNFNDLFLIYGNACCGRNQNCSDCSRDAKDNDLSSDVGEYNQSPANDEPVRIAWTVKMDHYLIGLLLEQLNRGNKIGGTFNKKAWSWITESFNKVFGLLCERDILENRYYALMRVYKDVTNLLNQNGIDWDEIEHMSRANDVWEAYVEEYPDVAFGETIRNNYNNLCLLIGNVNQNRRPDRVRIKLKTSNNNFSMETDKIMGDLQSSAGGFKIPDGRKRRIFQAVSTSPNARKVQKTLLGEMQEDLQERKDNSIERIVAALQTIPDLDDELFLEACLLLEVERKARMFVAMDAAARRRWLFKKLHQ